MRRVRNVRPARSTRSSESALQTHARENDGALVEHHHAASGHVAITRWFSLIQYVEALERCREPLATSEEPPLLQACVDAPKDRQSCRAACRRRGSGPARAHSWPRKRPEAADATPEKVACPRANCLDMRPERGRRSRPARGQSSRGRGRRERGEGPECRRRNSRRSPGGNRVRNSTGVRFAKAPFPATPRRS